MFKLLKKISIPGVVIALIFLLIQVFSNLYIPYLTADIVNQGILKSDLGFIISQGQKMLLFSGISLVAALLNTYIASKVSFKFGSQLRGDLYEKVLSFSQETYDRFGASSLITRNITDVSQVQNLVAMCLKFLVLAPLYLIGGIWLSFKLSPKLAMIFVAVLPILFIAGIIVQKYASPLYSKMQQTIDQLNLIFREGLTGIKVIRAFNQETAESQRYEKTALAYQKTSIHAGTIMSIFTPFISLVMNLTMLGIIWIGGFDVSAGVIEVGTIMAVLSYSGEILMGFSILTSVILAVPRGQASAIRISEVLETPSSSKVIADEGVVNSELTAISTISFDQVSFSYGKSNKMVLQEINYEVKKGETLAIIGGTGDGKSSLIKLLTGIYQPTNGTVKLNGQDLQNFDKSQLAEAISVTPQQGRLFQGTIRSNLLIAQPKASDDDLWQALEIADCCNFVLEKGGLDSLVEKAGGNFSGGQKQRLCLARTLLKEGEIYIFDDSFSALDFKTDKKIRGAINQKLANKIKVIVAQRINTVQEADKIILLNQGEIAGFGNHQELIENNEIYQEIVQSQTEERVVA